MRQVVTPVISSKEICGGAETHGGLYNYKETAGDTPKQVSKYRRIVYMRRIYSSPNKHFRSIHLLTWNTADT